MKKFIKVLLVINQKQNSIKEIEIESLHGLHELEIYILLEKLAPAFIKVNSDDPDSLEGYSYEYLNGLQSVVIYRVN